MILCAGQSVLLFVHWEKKEEKVGTFSTPLEERYKERQKERKKDTPRDGVLSSVSSGDDAKMAFAFFSFSEDEEEGLERRERREHREEEESRDCAIIIDT